MAMNRFSGPGSTPPALCLASTAVALGLCLSWPGPAAAQSPPAGADTLVDLAVLAQGSFLSADTREVSFIEDGSHRGVHLSDGPRPDVAWIEGLTFSTGTLEVEVRGKDAQGQSFVGLAFASANDSTYESVYLRPFNFRATDPVRRKHAVQYHSLPTHPWSRLRSEAPEVYENPVDPAPAADEWVRLRLVIEPTRVRVFVGEGAEPDLVVDRIEPRLEGRIGLWVGNASDGDFANLRIIADPP